MRRTFHRHSRTIRERLNQHRPVLLRVAGAGVGLLVLAQLLYPGNRMPLFASVDGVNVSGWNKQEAIERLDDASKAARIEVGFDKLSDRTLGTPKLDQIGLMVSNADRISAASYPWYLRIVPTSLFWFGPAQTEQPPAYSGDTQTAQRYVQQAIGTSCQIPARDATLKLASTTLNVVASEAGGSCQEDQVVKTLLSSRPRINKQTSVKIPIDVIAPRVGDDDAKKLADSLNKNTQSGVPLTVADKRITISQQEILSWLDFKSAESELTYVINPDRSNVYFTKQVTPVIAKPAGVTKVSTLDFTETSRADGATGQTLAIAATVADITKVLNNQKKAAVAVAQALPPSVQYSRSYSKSSTGIAAQIRFYDEDNKGVFGVSFTELDGQKLTAQHNAGRQFVTASTYKLFVAYSVLRRVDAGQLKLDEPNIAGGRNLSTCFDDMIVKSDNPCAEAFIKKIGAKDLNADIKSIGLSDTAFRSDNNLTTAADLAIYLTQLQTSKLPIKPESRDRLLAAMKRNVYRQGVPSGASGQVADKVGFLWGYLHDAAIVYSPKGTYVLTVMSDGSSWAAIADLTRKIEALR